MSFLESIQKRYTTKVYNPEKKIPKEKIEVLKEILRMSPSSINSQPWKFIFVSDSELKEELAKVSNYNADKIRNCDTVVVFTRYRNIEDLEEDIFQRLPERTQEYYKANLQPLSELEIKAWMGRQLYLALGVFLSACAEMQIDSTPMEGIIPSEYDQILSLNTYETEVAVAIGYRDAEDFNDPIRTPKVRKDKHQVIEHR